uniref:DUF38 domain-containing protein n=1 Tax=Panagrolaimus davidi TaxID=227884 RepID=A0A914QHQ9_9BILA
MGSWISLLFSKTETSSMPNEPDSNLGLPEYILYYVAKNVSSPALYQKLIKSNKYFYQKNPILLLHCLKLDNGKWLICSKIGGKSCDEINGEMCSDLKCIDMNKISTKICVTNVLDIFHLYYDDITPLNLPAKFKSNVVIFKAVNKILSIEQLSLIGSSVKTCELLNVTVKKNDQTIASFEEIIQCLPNVEEFQLRGHLDHLRMTSKGVKELSKVLQSSKIKKLFLRDVAEMFDIEEFYQLFLKDNKTMQIDLGFIYHISEAYNERLSTIINTILDESKLKYFYPPIIIGSFFEAVKLAMAADQYVYHVRSL